jgi:hypothetical protein
VPVIGTQYIIQFWKGEIFQNLESRLVDNLLLFDAADFRSVKPLIKIVENLTI